MSRGTEGSNPASSSGESANFRSLEMTGVCLRRAPHAISMIRKTAGAFQEQHGIFGPVASATAEAAALIARVRSTFQVSADAARVRLTKLELLAAQAHGPSLFSSR